MVTFPDFLKSSVYLKFLKYVDNIDSERTHSCLNPKQVSNVRRHFEHTTFGRKSFSFTLKTNLMRILTRNLRDWNSPSVQDKSVFYFAAVFFYLLLEICGSFLFVCWMRIIYTNHKNSRVCTQTLAHPNILIWNILSWFSKQNSHFYK